MRGDLFSVRRAWVEMRRRRLRPLPSVSVTAIRLGCQRRLVWRWECETLQPLCARLPVIAQTLAISSFREPLRGAKLRAHAAPTVRSIAKRRSSVK